MPCVYKAAFTPPSKPSVHQEHVFAATGWAYSVSLLCIVQHSTKVGMFPELLFSLGSVKVDLQVQDSSTQLLSGPDARCYQVQGT